jgi:hypothetical protein
MSHRDRNSSAPRRTRALLIIAAAVVVGTAGGCGSASGPTTSAQPPQPAPAQTPATPSPGSATGVPNLVAQRIGRLRTPLRDAAGVPLGPGAGLLIGGVDAHGTPVSTLQLVRRGTDIPIGHLSQPLPDASAVSVGGAVYLIGQRTAGSRPVILRVDPRTGRTELAGRLAQPRSAPATVVVGDTVYVIGGYDGRRPLDTVLAWRPGSSARTVATLPYEVGDATAAAAQGRVLIAGGTTPSGPTARILSFTPATGAIAPLGTLPAPIMSAAAVTLDGHVYVIGGRGARAGSQTADVLGIGADGTAAGAGLLPFPLSDATVIPDGTGILIAGGLTPHGLLSDVLELAPGAVR